MPDKTSTKTKKVALVNKAKKPLKKELKKPTLKTAAQKPTPIVAPNAVVAVETAKKALAKEKGVKEGKARPDAALQNQATGPLAQKWSQLFKKSEAIESKPYNMKATYVEKTAIVHKVLGWGYIMANRNDRLEVLFKDGIKYLISNYK